MTPHRASDSALRGAVAAEAGGGPSRILPLDGLRGIAVLVVVIHNSAWIAGESQHFLLKLTTAITATGWLGVQIFFALSGFLITGILLDTVGQSGYFRSFYLRRSLRIFPLYYVFLLLVLVLALVLGAGATFTAPAWYYWVYLQNWFTPFHESPHALAHLWSLAVEEQFYLLWALIVWGVSRRGLVRLCIGLLLVTPIIRLLLREAGLPQITAYDFTIARWDALAAGALVALLARDAWGREWLARWQGWAVAASVLGVAAVVAIQHGFHQDSLGTQVIGQSGIAVISAGIIAMTAVGAGDRYAQVRRALSLPGLRTLGKYSYAMYIFHLPIARLLEPVLGEVVRGPDTPWRLLRLSLYVALVLGLTLVCSLVSWRVLEQPCLRLKDRIAPRPAAVPGLGATAQ